LNDLRFLIVEDHAFQRTLLEQMLRGLGAQQVRSVANGKDALRLLGAGAERYDIVITDLMMPEVDGIELIPALRKLAQPVALVLASVDPASLEMAVMIARGHGMRVLGAIDKPITPDKLRPVLDKFHGG
jgi:CheY-like chemotaxis protein